MEIVRTTFHCIVDLKSRGEGKKKSKKNYGTNVLLLHVQAYIKEENTLFIIIFMAF